MHSLEHIVFHRPGPRTVATAGPSVSAPDQVKSPRRATRKDRPPADAKALAFAREALALAGLDPMAYRPEPLIRRLPACLRALGCPNFVQARAAIHHDQSALRKVVNNLLIGVTWFCRDALAVQALQRQVRSAPRRQWRVWSAGCSDGAELYSVAMMLSEAEQLEGAQLLGTDCRAAAVERAREARYTAERLEHLPEPWQERYLSRDGAQWVVHDHLRQCAQWRTQNLLDERGGDSEQFDLVLCRNVAIYLAQDACQQLWRNLMRRLMPGGLLVVGKAERPERDHPLTRLGACVYQKQE